MEEKTYTLNIRHTGIWQYEVTIPEIGVMKTAPTLIAPSLSPFRISSSISHLVLSFWYSLINPMTRML
jgi:hypothetical protein